MITAVRGVTDHTVAVCVTYTRHDTWCHIDYPIDDSNLYFRVSTARAI